MDESGNRGHIRDDAVRIMSIVLMHVPPSATVGNGEYGICRCPAGGLFRLSGSLTAFMMLAQWFWYGLISGELLTLIETGFSVKLVYLFWLRHCWTSRLCRNLSSRWFSTSRH